MVFSIAVVVVVSFKYRMFSFSFDIHMYVCQFKCVWTHTINIWGLMGIPIAAVYNFFFNVSTKQKKKKDLN